MMRYGGYGYGYGGGFFGWMIMMCIFFIAIIAVIIYLITRSGRRNTTATAGSAINILNERFARGEIDEEQYKRMKDTLEKR